MLTGVAFRFDQWWDARDIFLDEANLLRNIYDRGFLELLLPLYHDQFAPVGYLWLLKLATLIFPATEFGLRTLPFLISMATLLVFAKWIYKSVGYTAGIWALGAFIAGGLFLRYSVEIKQYGLDMLATVSLMYLYSSYRENRSSRTLFTLILAGWIAIFFSMPSIFILAGIGIAEFFTQEKISTVTKPVIAMATWLGAFGLNFIFFLRHGISDGGLQQYHENYFLGADLVNNFKLINTLIYSSTGHTVIAIAVGWLLLLAGWTFLYKEKKWLLLSSLFLVLGPLLASLTHHYSLIPRLLLFTLPVVLVVQAHTFSWIQKRYAKAALPAVIIWCLLVIPGSGNWSYITGKLTIDEYQQPLELLAKRNDSTEIYVHHHAWPGVSFYMEFSDAHERYQDLPVVKGKWQDWQDGEIPRELRSRPVYLLIVHMGKDEKDDIMARVRETGQMETIWENPEGDAILYFP